MPNIKKFSTSVVIKEIKIFQKELLFISYHLARVKNI